MLLTTLSPPSRFSWRDCWTSHGITPHIHLSPWCWVSSGIKFPHLTEIHPASQGGNSTNPIWGRRIGVCVCVCVCVCCAQPLQSCPTCDPVDHSPPGFSVLGIFPPRILEWVAMPSSRGSSQPRDRNCLSCISSIAGTLYMLRHWGSPGILVVLFNFLAEEMIFLFWNKYIPFHLHNDVF